jgi:NitT/TauT family transport system substrate-binding protein
MTFRGIRLPSAVAAAAVLVLATSCVSRPAASPGLEKTDIVVDAFPTIDASGLYIAKMDGLFARAGLNVTIKAAPTSQAAITGQRRGVYDVTSADYVTYLDNEVTNQVRLRIVAEASFLQPHVLMLLGPPGSAITSVAQLRGETIGLAAPHDIASLLVDLLLEEYGISPAQVRFKTGVPLPSVGQDLRQGIIDAAPAPEPFISLSEERFGVQPLADLDQGATADFPIQGYAVTQAWARKYPNTLRAFVRALTEGQRIADTSRDAVERAVEKFLGIPAQTAALIALPDFPLSVDPVRLQRVVNAMVEFGLLPRKYASFKVASMVGLPARPGYGPAGRYLATR